jgi:hypothetical protein
MALNDVLHIKDLHLPAGVRVIPDGELIVATVREVLEEVVATPVEGETAEPEVIGRKPAEEGEEGAAGAKPEAGGAAAAKPEAKKKE